MNRFLALFFSLSVYYSFSQTTFTVNSSVDDGTGDVASSLSECIEAANLNPGHDIIDFDPSITVIDISGALPALTDDAGVTINGWPADVSAGSPNTTPIFGGTLNAVYAIVLNNVNNVPTGLILTGNTNTITGIVFQDFGDGTPSANDIAITITSKLNTIIGCYIGVDADGETPGTKTYYGIHITGTDNFIGDGTPEGINLISGMNTGVGTSAGIYIAASGVNIIKGNIIGLQKDASNIPSGATQQYGIHLLSSNSNIIGGTASGDGNLISGNVIAGIYSDASSDNVISGNRMGTRWNGSTVLASGSQLYGIYSNVSYGNIIGGSTSGHRNIISANTAAGIYLLNGATGTQIKGNYIGISSSGTANIASNSQDYGVNLSTSTFSITIGGTGTGEGNVISGNTLYGIFMRGGNHNIYGNIVGAAASGTTSLAGSQTHGIYVSGSYDNIIGGSTSGHRNVISDNNLNFGLYFTGATTTGNVVKGNYIGLAPDGSTFITSNSQRWGIGFAVGANNNIIGGTNANEGNVLSGNTDYGVSLSASNNNYFYGNIIGLQKDGMSTVTNNVQYLGINLLNSSTSNVIGGTISGQGNIITGNYKSGATSIQNEGIYITGGASGNSILGNYIGVGSDGATAPANNQQYGIYFFGSGSNAGKNNTIGGTNPGEGNVISGNGNSSLTGYGINQNSPNGFTYVYGNIIGLAKNGSSLVTGTNYQSYGIAIGGFTPSGYAASAGSPSNVIGGTGNGKNTISGNTSYGVYITGASSTGTIIKGNYIGTATDGSTFLTGNSQDYGIYLSTTAPATTIGGTGTGEGNVISGNGAATAYGIYLDNAGNSIFGNIIGAKAVGTTTLQPTNNQDYGIYINNKGSNVIGGTSSAYRNVISDNTNSGIFITGASATNTTIKGNYIGIAADGTTLISGNAQATGVYLDSSAPATTIGGTGTGDGNVLSGNASTGIYTNTTTAVNLICGNIIGPTATGATSLGSGNQKYGIHLVFGSANVIGGSTAAHKNTISDNTTAGIYIFGSASNLIKGNYIGIATDGATYITGNSQDYGVYMTNGARLNIVGGTNSGEGNIISGNYDGTAATGAGVFSNSTNTTGNTIVGNYIGTTASGTRFTDNQVSGIEINGSPKNTIGGTTAAYRNIISANGVRGIYITGAAATGNNIKGNYIGLASNGTSFVTSNSQDYGIYTSTSCPSVTIGGINPGEGNVISGNGAATAYGIYLDNRVYTD